MGAEVLNQDEIDALLKGVDDGAVATDAAATPGEGQAFGVELDCGIHAFRRTTTSMSGWVGGTTATGLGSNGMARSKMRSCHTLNTEP
jgi:hypothetical protein